MTCRRRAAAATQPARGRENRSVHAAAARFDLHVPHSRSLKQKRAVIRPVVDTLRHRYRLSVAEVDHLDRWQRAAIGVAVVAATAPRVEEILATVQRFVASVPDVELVDTEICWLDRDGAGELAQEAWP